MILEKKSVNCTKRPLEIYHSLNQTIITYNYIIQIKIQLYYTRRIKYMEKMGCYILGKVLRKKFIRLKTEIDRTKIEIDHLIDIERGD